MKRYGNPRTSRTYAAIHRLGRKPTPHTYMRLAADAPSILTAEHENTVRAQRAADFVQELLLVLAMLEDVIGDCDAEGPIREWEILSAGAHQHRVFDAGRVKLRLGDHQPARGDVHADDRRGLSAGGQHQPTGATTNIQDYVVTSEWSAAHLLHTPESARAPRRSNERIAYESRGARGGSVWGQSPVGLEHCAEAAVSFLPDAFTLGPIILGCDVRIGHTRKSGIPQTTA